MDRKISVDITVSTILKVVAVLGGLYLLFFLKEIFILLLFAFIFQAGFSPFVDRFEKKGLNRLWGIAIIYLVIIIFLGAAIGLIIPPVSLQIQNLFANFPDYLKTILSYFVSGGYAETIAARFRESINFSQAAQVGGGFLSTALGVFGGLFGIVLIMVLTFYFLVEKNALEQTLINILPPRIEEKVTAILKKFNRKMSLWLRGQAILSGTIGIITFTGLSILGVPYALALSLFAALAELIPLAGPFLSALAAVSIAFAQDPMLAAWVALFFFIMQQVENHLLVPAVMRKAVGLSPLITIISLLIGAKILGILGMIIAIPVTCGILIIGKELRKERSE